MSTFTLPPVLASWPWNRRENPHHNKVKAQSDQCFESFRAFEPKTLARFQACNFALVASLTYPFANATQLRVGHDLMNVFFVFDEYTDVQDGNGVTKLRNIVMDVLRHPYTQRSPSESVLGLIVQDFWIRATQNTSKTCQRVFLATFEAYVDAVIQEAADRTCKLVRNVDSYLEFRRNTAGPYPAFALLYMDTEIPEEILNHPKLERLTLLAGDMLIILQDMYSYDMEQFREIADHNLITVVMKEFDMTLNDAFKWAGERQKAAEAEFLQLRSQLPTWGTNADDAVAKYVNGLGYMIRGLDSWCFETPRYFGSARSEVQKTRVVRLSTKA